MCLRVKGCVVFALVALVLLPLGASGDPIFRIGTEAEWRQAILDGRVRGVPGAVFEQMVAEDTQWPDEYRYASFFDVFLEVAPNWQGEPCLYMAWGNSQVVGERVAGAWDYVYPQDPNLGQNVIEFSIFPPVPSTLFSLNIIDQFGNYREWIWHADVPGNPLGEVPAGQWATLVIDPVTGASNWPTFGGSPFIHNVPGMPPFDLGSVRILRFDENILGRQGDLFPDGPFGPLPDGWVWNAWDHVAVQPEPATLLLVGGGLLALARKRRRGK